MNFCKSIFSCTNAVNLALVGTSLLFLLQRQATAANKQTESPLPTQQKVCPSAHLLPKRSFDTPKYSVYICRGDNENTLGYYVRISKTDGANLTVPVSRTNGETYIAIKGEVGYAVTPYELVVTKKNRVILRERVNSAIAGDGQPLARGCPDGQNIFAEAKTKSFIVYICGGGTPTNYVVIARNGNTRISIPLQSYNCDQKTEASRFAAKDGDINYILTRKVLKISQGNRTLIKEKVLRWN
ncbi:MAG: hypothetical protein ACHBN1_02575 [Heteroscytonema crispum UTEX LB 1556]